uniref:Uncharacterized protein n=1 Tax=Micrurus lemniscatus lemniscatus TaxID=129467 RepID=A0A2D4HJ10_MICLE
MRAHKKKRRPCPLPSLCFAAWLKAKLVGPTGQLLLEEQMGKPKIKKRVVVCREEKAANLALRVKNSIHSHDTVASTVSLMQKEDPSQNTGLQMGRVVVCVCGGNVMWYVCLYIYFTCIPKAQPFPTTFSCYCFKKDQQVKRVHMF